jgi:tetratricopeptide (TPR) repeat protein
MNCINFANPDDVDIEWQRLSRALGVTLTPALLDAKSPDTASRDAWHLAHPYPMPPNFTGRLAERRMLTRWLNEDTENRLFMIQALGGFGKSALTWHWLTHDVDPAGWTKVLWWSFYEGDASFEHFIEQTLKYLKLDVPQGGRLQVNKLIEAMKAQKILLILDGFERALRAYSSMGAAYQGDEAESSSPTERGARGEGNDNQLDCVSVDAEYFLKSVCSLPDLKSKVLMTTRLTPRAVNPRGELMLGCRAEELTAMQPADAVEFFHRQKIKGTYTEIQTACASYGYHPLSLRLLAGRILKDFENPGDIGVAQKLKIDGDVIQQKHHVLEVSYNSLPPDEQKLLSTIACFRSPVEHKTLESIAENKDALDKDLRDLVERGLLHFDERNKKFDLHPIVRRFAYDHFTAPQRTNAHVILVVYFEAVPQPQKVEKLEDLAPVIELYHHMVRAGKLDEARKLFEDRINRPTYYQFGAYQLRLELLRALFLDGEDEPPRLKNEGSQAWTLNALANSYSLNGQSRRAIPLYEMHYTMQEKAGDKKNLAIGMGNESDDQLKIGAISAAERNLRLGIELAEEIDSKHLLDNWNRELGKVLAIRGMWQDSETHFEKAIEYAREISHIQDQGTAFAYRALRFLLLARDHPKSSTANRKPALSNVEASSIACAQRALELAEQWQKITGRSTPNPRDYTRSLWLLGAAYRASNEMTLAEENLSNALHLCRQINMVDYEADILLDLARLRYAQGDFEEALEKASEALTITERSGYVLQGADVNLFLAQHVLEQEKDKGKAKQYAETALKLAHCDDGPPYYYKVAYHEAERFLERLAG